MAVTKPYKRTCRPFLDGKYPDGRSSYISDPKFATAPQQYIRAFEVIQKDLLELFDYVEPADKNEGCYSFRIHELHMRTCIEIESNSKAILTENGYVNGSPDFWNMGDYKKINATHRLSSYRVKFPLWHGSNNVRVPFSYWSSGGLLAWYQAYNAAKHDRHDEFEQASFGTLLEAVAGLIVLLSSQFCTHDFSRTETWMDDFDYGDNFSVAIGNYLLVEFPNDWPQADRYSFDWEQLKKDPNRFQFLQF
jgi:hypothetical protein